VHNRCIDSHKIIRFYGYLSSSARKVFFGFLILAFFSTSTPAISHSDYPFLNSHYHAWTMIVNRPLLYCDSRLHTNLPVSPVIMDGILYAPAKAVADIFGWMIRDNPSSLNICLNNVEADEIEIYSNQSFYIFNKEKVHWMDQFTLFKPFLMDDHLMIPAEFFLKQLGAINVEFDKNNQRLHFWSLKNNLPQMASKFIINSTYPCYQGSVFRNGKIIDECSPKSLLLKVKWTHEVLDRYTTSPVVFGDLIYIADRTGTMSCLDILSGKVRWKKMFTDRLFSTPFVTEDFLYFGSWDEHFYCLDRFSGNLIWKTNLHGMIQSSPLLFNGQIFIGTLQAKFFCLDLKSGKVQWFFEAEDEIASSPCTDGKSLFFGCRDYHVYALYIETGHLKWKTATKGCTFATPCILEGKLYQGSQDDHLYCICPEEGAIVWKSKTQGGIYGTASLFYDRVIIGSQDGNLYAFHKDTGKELWTYQDIHAIFANPLISGKRIYIGTTGGKFYVINAGSGKLIHAYDLKDGINTSAAIASETVMIASGNVLYAFGNP
jgi:outer membrane protein assembly factor BamB